MKTDKDIENLLTMQRKISLSTSEKASIKSALLAHAAETLTHERKVISSPWTSWVFRSALSLASCFVIFTGAALASQNSLPGEPLYAMKIHVVEEMIALTKTSPKDRVAYDIQLMESRLEEIKEIIVSETTTPPEDLVTLTKQIDEHATDITITLEAASADHITYEEKLEALAKLSGVTGAQAKIAKRTPTLLSMATTLDETQAATDNAITDTIEDFVDDTSTTSVQLYLSDQITDVGEYVKASTTDALSRDTAKLHLENIDSALTEGNTAEAFESVFKAQETFVIDEYLAE